MLVLAHIAAAGVAQATTSHPQVIVEQVTTLGVFQGQPYPQVEELIVATFPHPEGILGSYRVPLIMAFPARHLGHYHVRPQMQSE